MNHTFSFEKANNLGSYVFQEQILCALTLAKPSSYAYI